MLFTLVSAISLGICLLRQGNKSKTKQVGLHQSKKLLHSKGNYHQNEKTIYQMGEDICKLYIQ